MDDGTQIVHIAQKVPFLRLTSVETKSAGTIVVWCVPFSTLGVPLGDLVNLICLCRNTTRDPHDRTESRMNLEVKSKRMNLETKTSTGCF